MGDGQCYKRRFSSDARSRKEKRRQVIVNTTPIVIHLSTIDRNEKECLLSVKKYQFLSTRHYPNNLKLG